MDDLFGKIDCRSKYDSVVMRILRSAMDKAHEKMQNMNGPIEFLHERSKFYEFATILVEGGLSIVEEETDVHESNREKIVYDLLEIKNWLQGRIEEMKMLIIEKDKELIESLENELKLRHALELNERELVYLRDKLELEQTKTSRVEDFLHEDEANAAGDILQELKIVVDEKAMNIKHMLERERRKKSLSNVSDSEVYSRIFDDDRSPSARSVEDELHSDRHEEFFDINPSKNNKMIQQMTSDIAILKKNLGLAFWRMQNAKLLPLEKQWKWNIEKDIMLVLVRGFICDIQESFNAEIRKRCCETWRCLTRENVMTNDLKSIRDELNALCNENHQSIIRPLSSESLTGTCSEKKEDHVARMMKNHQSIIQKHQKERNWLTREILLWKGSPAAFVSDTKVDQLHRRILEAITRLDNLIACYNNQIDAKHVCEDTDRLSFQQLNILVEYFKSSLREEIYVVYFQETLKEWNKDMRYNVDNPLLTKLNSSLLSQLMGFQQIIMEFDQMVNNKFHQKNLRLEDMKNQVALFAQSMVSIRQRKMLYKKAFLNRCINLQLAENEVDLLGNQVQKLMSLLQKIYLIFSQNAKVLSSNVEVSEILHLIKKELSG